MLLLWKSRFNVASGIAFEILYIRASSEQAYKAGKTCYLLYPTEFKAENFTFHI